MSLKKVFKTDSIKEKSGVWIPIPQGEGSEDCEFLISLMGPGNKKYVAAMQANQKKYKHSLKSMSDERQRELMIDVFIDTVLLDWKNVEEYRSEKLLNGPCEMPFSKENAKFLLTDLPQVLEILSREASEFSNFVEEQTEEDAKK